MNNVGNGFRYILRYTICPAHAPDERIEELMDFCLQSRTGEVMLFFTAEELTCGHPTTEELRPWFGVAKKLKDGLDKHGIALSLNPWTTTFHVARGRRLREGQDFTLMVGETGAVSPISACPLCENWQRYLCDLFALMAREIKPTAIWVEDDWRLHNHEADMGFGGCFCELHMRRFSEVVGREVSREQLLEAVLAPDEPHPWRAKWMELWRQTMIEPAIRLRKAVRQANPSTRLALMSSNPDVHSIEGRDWHALQDALGFEPTFLTRPNLPPYTEAYAMQAVPAVTRLTLANLKRPIEIFPELESSPRCGIYSKSVTYTLWECLNSPLYGADGITINHFDMMGNGTTLDPVFAAGLAGAKDRLDALACLNVDDNNAQGVKVLFHPDVAAHRVCNDANFNPDNGSAPDRRNGQNLAMLQNHTIAWAQTLYILGIAFGFTDNPAETADTPLFVGDQTIRAFDDEQIRRMLAGDVVLDAPTVEILLERGFGDMIGVEDAEWRKLDDTAFAYEYIPQKDKTIHGIADPRMTASGCADELLAMTPANDGDVRTWICKPDHTELFPGLLVHRNAFGGGVVSMAYPLDQHQFFMGYFNVYRKILMQDILFELAPCSPLAVSRETPLHIYRVPTEQGLLIGAMNPTMDEAQEVALQLGDMPEFSAANVKILDQTGRWRNTAVSVNNDGKIQKWTIGQTIKPLDGMFLLVEH